MSQAAKKKRNKLKKFIKALSNQSSVPNIHVQTNDAASLAHLIKLKRHENDVVRLQQENDRTFVQSPNSTELVRWLKEQHGATNPDVYIRASSIAGAGNGVFVADGIADIPKKIKSGTTVITVPVSSMISSLDATKDPTLRPLFIASRVLQQQPSLQLALLLLCEVYKEDASRFQPYLQTFPSTFSLPLWWNVTELEKLRGTSALRAVARNVVSFARYYCHIESLLSTEYGGGKSGGSALPFPLSFFTLNNVKWSMSVVMTRQNPIPYKNMKGQVAGRCLALVPIMDMVNHGAELEHGVFYDDETDTVNVACMTGARAGEEVRMYYGDRTNQEFLVHSGFVTKERNQNDGLTMLVQISEGTDPLYKVRMLVLKSEGFVGVGVQEKEEKTTEDSFDPRTCSPCYVVSSSASVKMCPLCQVASGSRTNFELDIKRGDSGVQQLRNFAQIILLGKDGIRTMLTQKRTSEEVPSILSTLPLERCLASAEEEEEKAREIKLQWAMRSYVMCAVLRRTRHQEQALEETETITLADARRLQEIQLLEELLKKMY
jgi:histone-lysine N-methyltransferase SETD3